MAQLGNAHKQLLRRALGTCLTLVWLAKTHPSLAESLKRDSPYVPPRVCLSGRRGWKGRAEWPVPQPYQKYIPQLQDCNNGNDNNSKSLDRGLPCPSIISWRWDY